MRNTLSLFRNYPNTFAREFDLAWPFWADQTEPNLANERGLLTFAPAIDVVETGKEYRFTADLPGLTDKDIQLNLTGRHLKISGERQYESETKTDKVHRTERAYGKFERNFQLPEDVNAEKVEASFKNGVLTVVIPKVETAQPRTIQIKAH